MNGTSSAAGTVIGIHWEFTVVERGSLAIVPKTFPAISRVVEALSAAGAKDAPHWVQEHFGHAVGLRASCASGGSAALAPQMAAAVRAMNSALAQQGLMLLPTATHPLWKPDHGTALRPPALKGVFNGPDGLLPLDRHGRSNLRTVSVDLPFNNDQEFGKLHAAVRVLLPLLPALSASAPLVEGLHPGKLDPRPAYREEFAASTPGIMGAWIPEAVFTEEDYYRQVFDPSGRELAEYGTDQIRHHSSINERGAVARFDDAVVGIHAVDAQESPSMTMAVVELITAVVQAMVDQRWASNYVQRAWHEADLLPYYLDAATHGGKALVSRPELLMMYGLPDTPMTMRGIWEHLLDDLSEHIAPANRRLLEQLLAEGSLAERILRRTGTTPDVGTIKAVYGELALCLQEDRPFR